MNPKLSNTFAGLAIAIAIWAATSPAAPGRPSGDGDGSVFAVAATMRDGSILKGTPAFDRLDLTTPYGRLRIPLAALAQAAFSTTNGKPHAMFFLHGDDRISGRPSARILPIVSPYGALRLPVADLRRLTVSAAAPAGSAPVSLPRVPGLILYYPFDEDLGDVVRDASGGGRTAQVDGAVWTPDGARGGAYRFAHNRQAIVATDAGLPRGDEPRSIAAWMKLDVKYSRELTNFLCYGTDGFRRQLCALGFDWRDGREHVYFSPGGACFLGARRLPPPGTWLHVAYTYGGNGRHHLYIDGEPGDGMSELSGPIDTRLSGELRLGGTPNSIGPDNGYLDEVMVFDRELSAEEVQSLVRHP